MLLVQVLAISASNFELEFNTKLSAETISSITDRVLPEIKSWRSRMLDPVYAICWLDAIHYKVKEETGRAVSRTIYNVLGINKEGQKELLGMYISKSEGANFRLEVLSDLQSRGVQEYTDMLHWRSERLPWCYTERIPRNKCPTLYCPSNTQLYQTRWQ